jgi:hypothetical protein
MAEPTEIKESGNRANRKTNANLGIKAIGMPIGSAGRNLDPMTARNADNDAYVLEGIPFINRGRGVIDPTPNGPVGRTENNRSNRRRARDFVNRAVSKDEPVADSEFDVDEQSPPSLFGQEELFDDFEFDDMSSAEVGNSLTEIEEEELAIDYNDAWRAYLEDAGLDPNFEESYEFPPPNFYETMDSQENFEPQSDILSEYKRPSSILPKSNIPRERFINTTPYGGDRYVVTHQALELAKHRQLADSGQWRKIHNDHYDWWMFPIDRGSGAYGEKYNIAGKPLKRLKRNRRFLKNVAEAIKINALALAWDIETSKYIDNINWDAGQDPWLAYPTRIWKMTRSAQVLGLKKEFESLLLMQQSLADGGIKFNHNDYWDNPGDINNTKQSKYKNQEETGGVGKISSLGQLLNTNLKNGLVEQRKKFETSISANPLYSWISSSPQETMHSGSSLTNNDYGNVFGFSNFSDGEPVDWFDFWLMTNDIQPLIEKQVDENFKKSELFEKTGYGLLGATPADYILSLLKGESKNPAKEQYRAFDMRRAGIYFMGINGVDEELINYENFENYFTNSNQMVKKNNGIKITSTLDGWKIEIGKNSPLLWSISQDERESVYEQFIDRLSEDSNNAQVTPDYKDLKNFFKLLEERQVGFSGSKSKAGVAYFVEPGPVGSMANNEPGSNTDGYLAEVTGVPLWEQISGGKGTLSNPVHRVNSLIESGILNKGPDGTPEGPMTDTEMRDWFGFVFMANDLGLINNGYLSNKKSSNRENAVKMLKLLSENVAESSEKTRKKIRASGYELVMKTIEADKNTDDPSIRSNPFGYVYTDFKNDKTYNWSTTGEKLTSRIGSIIDGYEWLPSQ